MTAGPTREYLDPVRFVSSPSSGKMGFAIAQAAAARGARVTLVTGPTFLTPPPQVQTIRAVTARQMQREVLRHARESDIVFMAAAVSDWRPVRTLTSKFKKSPRHRILRIPFRQNPDILERMGRHKKRGQILVGFAAETERLIPNALGKLRRKNLDLIAANLVGPQAQGSGFEGDSNRITVVYPDGRAVRFPLLGKYEAARRLIGLAVQCLRSRSYSLSK